MATGFAAAPDWGSKFGMDARMTGKSRMFAAAISVLAGTALLAQFAVNVADRGTAPAGELLRLYGWFTIWSNTAVAIVAGQAALAGRARGLTHPALLAATTVWIVVVALVYNVLLANLNHPPTLLRQIIDHVFHVVTPLAWTLWWLVLRPCAALRWRHLPAVLPLPLAYCAFSLWLGAKTGRYAYFFIDVSRLGWSQVVINIAALAGLFAVLMLLAIVWDRRRRPSHLLSGG